MIFTPPQVAKRWHCTPERVLQLIRAGRLRAFTLSPASSRRPRWRITEDAVAEFERGDNRATPAPAKPAPRRRRPADYIEFFK